MTKLEAISLALRWLDEATVNGETMPAEQIADFRDRAAHMLDGAVNFLGGLFKIPAIYSVVNQPLKNLLGETYGVERVMPGETYAASAPAARSMYVELCGHGCITVTHAGVTVDTHTFDTPDKFTAYRKNLGALTGGVTVTVTADYPVSCKNLALYPCEFPEDADIPVFSSFVKYDMPDDFREFDKLLYTSDRSSYTEFSDYRREGHKTYLVPRTALGQFDFHYWKNPTAIAANAADNTVLDIEERAAQLVPLKLAVDLTVAVDEMMTASYYLQDKFQFMISNILTEDRGGVEGIQTIYGM